jgi:hypothetical protein
MGGKVLSNISDRMYIPWIKTRQGVKTYWVHSVVITPAIINVLRHTQFKT